MVTDPLTHACQRIPLTFKASRFELTFRELASEAIVTHDMLGNEDTLIPVPIYDQSPEIGRPLDFELAVYDNDTSELIEDADEVLTIINKEGNYFIMAPKKAKKSTSTKTDTKSSATKKSTATTGKKKVKVTAKDSKSGVANSEAEFVIDIKAEMKPIDIPEAFVNPIVFKLGGPAVTVGLPVYQTEF